LWGLKMVCFALSLPLFTTISNRRNTGRPTRYDRTSGQEENPPREQKDPPKDKPVKPKTKRESHLMVGKGGKTFHSKNVRGTHWSYAGDGRGTQGTHQSNKKKNNGIANRKG